MSVSRPIVALAAALVVAACQDGADVTAPVDAAPVAARAHQAGSGVVASASGSGHVRQSDGTLRKFTVSAVRLEDGTVSGQYDLKLTPLHWLREDFDVVPPVLSLRGTITCMSTDGNSAYIGGTLDEHINAELFFGRDDFTGVAIELIDNGVGPDAAADQISSVFVYFPDTGSTPQDWCDEPVPGDTFPIEQGDIQVH